MSKNIFYCGTSDLEEVISLNLLDFNFFNFEVDLNNIDFLVFTSKRGVKSLDLNNNDWKKIKCLCIGEETSKFCKSLGGDVFYTSKNKLGIEFSNEIKDICIGKNILVISNKKPNFDICSHFNDFNIKCEFISGYESVMNIFDIKPYIPTHSFVIISSPLYFKSFINNWDNYNDFNFICIGKNTFDFVNKFGTRNVFLSDNISILSCIDKFKELRK